MTRRLLLLRHAPTAATREHVFPRDEDLDVEGAGLAAGLAGRFVGDLAPDRVVSSPARRCLATAAGAGLTVGTVDQRLTELDFGAWAGRGMQEVWETERDVMERWMADPRVPTPGGEGWDELAARVTAALDDLAATDGTTLAVTHGGVVKCAVATVLGAPPEAVWRLHVEPCTVTVLRADARGGWQVAGLNRDLRDPDPRA